MDYFIKYYFKLIYLGGVLLFVKVKSDYQYVNFFFAAGTIAANGFFTFLIFRKYGFSFTNLRRSEMKSFLFRDFRMFSSQIFVAIQLYSPVVLVSIFGGNYMAGQYKIVEQIVVTFKTYIFLFFNFTYPRVCYDIAQNPGKAMRNWFWINMANIVFIVFLMTAVYVFSDKVVTFFHAVEIDFMSKLLKVAVFIPVVLAVSIAFKQLLLGYNMQKEYVRITLATVIISLLMIILLLPHYQLAGVLYSLIAAEAFVILFYLICLRKETANFRSGNA